MSDPLGDRMKVYERVESDRRLMPLLPAVVRLDGKCFSGFTRGLPRPFDARLSDLMLAVTRLLVEETGAVAGYTQSDEITLAMYSATYGSRLHFDGRVQKLCSVLAAQASVWFAARLPGAIPERAGATPVFDCRAWNVPTLEEAANAFLWRELDATKNAVSMAARHHFSHSRLHGLDGAEMQELLFREAGVNFNDYAAFFRRGRYVLRRKVTRRFTPEEIDLLPPRHAARTNPALEVERSEVAAVELPPLSRVANRVGVLFRGEEPNQSTEE